MPPTPQATTTCLSDMASKDASYVRLRPDKTAPGHDGRRAPGAGKGIQREITLACDAMMYEQYDILHRWAHLSGTQ